MNEQGSANPNTLASIDASLKQISNSIGHLVAQLEDNKTKNQGELVNLLIGLGYDRSQIAGILNTKAASVTARIAERKPKAKK